jgi:hypothetical protein
LDLNEILGAACVVAILVKDLLRGRLKRFGCVKVVHARTLLRHTALAAFLH